MNLQSGAPAIYELPHAAGPRLEQVLKELSVELPPYDWAGRAEGPGAAGRLH